YIFVFIVSAVWFALVSPEQFQEQTAASEQIAAAFGTLPLAFFLAITVALGEEILFRGALQPVFGLWVTSIYFALLHTQYTLTPASLTIVVVALGFSWLRQRYSTTAAITAHFLYNLVLLALPLLFGSSGGGWTRRKPLLARLIALLHTQNTLGQGTNTPSPSPTFTPSETATPTETSTPTITPTIPPTPASTMEGFAIDGSGEVIFPEAIRFTIVLSRPVSEIEAISLTIDTQNRAPFTP